MKIYIQTFNENGELLEREYDLEKIDREILHRNLDLLIEDSESLEADIANEIAEVVFGDDFDDEAKDVEVHPELAE